MGHLNLSSDQDIHVSLGFTFHAFVFMNLETIINTDSVLEYQFNKIISSCLRIIFFVNDKKSKVSSNHRCLPCQEIFWWIRISGFYKWILVSKTKKEKVIKLEYCLKGEWLITNVRRENSSMILLITRWFHTLSHVDRRGQFDSNAFDNFFFSTIECFILYLFTHLWKFRHDLQKSLSNLANFIENTIVFLKNWFQKISEGVFRTLSNI